jgi:polyisoprenyl-phosphate glycosyltransferase
MQQPEVSIIVPLYNEEKVFKALIERLTAVLNSLAHPAEVVMVDDGSRDFTAQLMEETAFHDDRFKAVFLSRNYGHQLAVSAGMAHVSASQAVMIIDGDLQDPPELLAQFYAKIKEGYEVVFAIRKKRKENFFKRLMYWSFYRLVRSISEVELPLDSGDFCMISRRVNDTMVAMPEQSRFIRGMRTWVGFKQIGIAYERDKRAAGEPKYTFKMLFKLAYDGIFNFSYVPLKLITKLGLYSILVSLLYLTYVLVKKMLGYPVPSGFTALIFAISLFSGVQLICLGVIGEYVSRIYMQVKDRPLFLIKKVIANKEEQRG